MGLKQRDFSTMLPTTSLRNTDLQLLSGTGLPSWVPNFSQRGSSLAAANHMQEEFAFSVPQGIQWHSPPM